MSIRVNHIRRMIHTSDSKHFEWRASHPFEGYIYMGGSNLNSPFKSGEWKMLSLFTETFLAHHAEISVNIFVQYAYFLNSSWKLDENGLHQWKAPKNRLEKIYSKLILVFRMN